MVLAGTDGWATSASVMVPSFVIGSKSATASYGTRLSMLWLEACVVLEVMKMV